MYVSSRRSRSRSRPRPSGFFTFLRRPIVQIKRLDEDPYLDHSKKSGLEVSTIDRYQGRDKDAIVLSLVRSNTKGKAGRLLEDYRRLNVALSRAKYKLIILGPMDTLSKGSSVLKPILDGMKAKGWIETLPENALSLYD